MAVNYDDIIDQETTGKPLQATSSVAAPSDAPPAIQNPYDKYDSVIDQDTNDRKAALQQSVYVASQKNPDKQAKVIDLSKQLGLAPSVVEGNEDLAQQKVSQNSVDYDKMLSQNPKTATWLQDPTNASVTHDDIPNASAHENLVNNTSAIGTFFSYLKSLYGTNAGIKSAFKAGFEGSSAGLAAFNEMPTDQPPENPSVVESFAGQAGGLLGDLPAMLAGGLGGAMLGAPAGGVAGSAVPVVGTLGGIAGGVVLGGGAGAFALPAAIKTALIQHIQKGDIKDLPDLLDRAEDIFKESSKQGALGALTTAAGGIFGAGLSKLGASTAVQTVGKLAAEDVAMTKGGAAMDGKDTKWRDYLDNALVIGAMHTPEAVGAYLDARKSDSIKNALLDIEPVAADSKLKERSPEKFNEMVGELAQGTPSENVYLPIEAATKYFQGKNIDPKTAFTELQAGDSFDEAQKTGGDIKVPFKNFVEKLAGTEHYQGLVDDLKFDPADKTVNEAKVEAEAVGKKMQSADEEAQAAAPDVEAGTPTTIGDTVSKQLQDTGVDKKTADTHGQVMESVFNSLGERSGKDPQDLFDQYKLRIRSGDANDSTGTLLNQDSVKNSIGESFEGQDAIDRYKAMPETRDGTVISQDTARKLHEPYAASNEGATIHLDATNEPAQKFAQKMYEKALEKPGNDPVIFLAGGTASGKSTYENTFGHTWEGATAVVDSTGSNLKVMTDNIERALAAKKPVLLSFIYRPFDKALESNVERFNETGRLVPPNIMAHTHVAALDTFLKLAEKYKDNPDVEFEAHDNSGINHEEPKAIPVDELDALRYNKAGESVNAATKSLKADASKRLENELEQVRQTKERAAAAEESSAPGASGEVGGLQEGESGLVQKGQSKLEQRNGDGPRGQIVFDKDNNFSISLLKNADMSTFIHESGHFYLEILGNLADHPDGAPELKDDYSAVLKWLGADSRADITPEMHEKWARGFEAYVMEGKAPSSALREAFARMKVWLVNIYRHAKNLNVELSPQIRGVMDRLVATDQQIKEAQTTQHQEPLFGRVGAYAMSDAKAEKYYKAFEDAKEHAEGTVTKKLMADYNREREAWYKSERDKVKATVAEEVEKQRVYRTLDILQKGKLDPLSDFSQHAPDGAQSETKVKLSKDGLIELMGASEFQKLKDIEGPYIYSREGGLHPEVAAPLLGYSSGMQMLREILDSPNKKDVIEKLTDAQMDQKYPDHFTDGSLPQDSIDAVHNDKRAQILRMELEHLAEHNMPVLKDMIRKVAKRVPSEEVIRDQATKIIGSKPLSEVSPYTYQLAEQKAAKMAGEALAKGDIDGTFEAKQKELLNHELYRAAKEARDDVDSQLKKFKKLARSDEDVSKTRDVDLVNAARAILAQFGLGKKDRPASSYLEKMKAYDPDTYSNISALVASATENPGNYKDMAYNDFVAMSHAVNAIYDLSKTSHQIEIDGVKMDREQAKAELIQQISEVAKPGTRPGMDKAVSKFEKISMNLLSAQASLTRVEHWVNAVDVDKNGPFRKYIWNPVAEAITDYRLKKGEVMDDYRKILDDVKGKITRQNIAAPELGYTFKDKTELLMALLHSGNESNLDKLLRGRSWGELREDGSLDTSKWDKFVSRMQKEGVLGKHDYDFAQKIWNLMEGLRPDAQRAHKNMYGYYFNEITAKELNTPYGDYKGGYIPAKVDLYTNEDAAIRSEREQFEKNNNAYQFPTTGRGFSKARVQEYAAPLSLEFSLLGGHIDSVLRFSHIEPHVKDVARIVADKEFRNNLSTLNPAAGKDLLMPWLQRAAQQKVVSASDTGVGRLLDAGARVLRKNVAMQIMVGNVTNALHQMTGLVVAMTKVDPKYMRNGLVNYITDIKGTNSTIMEKSEWMRAFRQENINDSQEAIHQIIADPNTFEKGKEFASKHTYFLQKAAHNVASSIIWSGGYEQSIAGGADEATAIREADAAVRMTQHMNAPEDIAAYETGTATKRMFTQFTGYFNLLANLNAGEMTRITRELGLKKGAGKLFYTYAMGFMLPAVMCDVIKKTMNKQFSNNNDDDDYASEALSVLFGSQLKTATAMIPYVGTMLNSVASGFDAHNNDDLRFSPVLSTIESMVKTPGEVYKSIDGEMDVSKKTVKDVLQLLGVASGLPIGPLGKPIGYMMDVNDGKADPKGPIDYARGMMTGHAGQ